MYPSSALCRAQQAYHRDRAGGALLENVRIVAMQAAMAWGNEALAAERREARYAQTRDIARVIAAREQKACEEDDRSFSENPDREFVTQKRG